MQVLPSDKKKIFVPPIKCQGIKTKLVGFISRNIAWSGEGKWIEPFLGSGVVLFNIQPERALVADTNKHIINFYKDIQSGALNELQVKEYLQENGVKLFETGPEYFYQMRADFNSNGHDSLKFLFLNRAGFNGLIRFNSLGKFNVPFNHKTDRFRRPYITKIVNQIGNIRRIIQNKDWVFQVADWREIISKAAPDDFVYLDPPYIGRHTDYYNSWSEQDAKELAGCAKSLKCGYALSMWKANKYRSNDHLIDWNGLVMRDFDHFYHVGSTESLRNRMTEVLAIKPENAVNVELLAS
jgi:DNA adenine methylase